MPKLKLSSIFNRFNTKGNKRKLIGLSAVLVIVLAGFVFWSFISGRLSGDKNLFAEAAGHKIYENDVRDLLADNNPTVSDNEAATVLADKYLLEALAEEEGVAITEEELVAEYGATIKKQKNDNKFAYQTKLNRLYIAKLQAHNRGAFKGKALVTHFSRNVPFDEEPTAGDERKIAVDRKYAENLINRLYSRINSGEITFEEAIKIEHNNRKIGKKGYPSLTHSGPIDTSVIADGLLQAESAREQVSKLAPGQLSEPFAVEVANSFDGRLKAESYFLVVQLDETSGGKNVDVDFEQYLQQAKERSGYGVYV